MALPRLRVVRLTVGGYCRFADRAAGCDQERVLDPDGSDVPDDRDRDVCSKNEGRRRKGRKSQRAC